MPRWSLRVTPASIIHTWITVLVLGLMPGCRAISRFGESRQSIAARKLSRLGLEAMHDGRWDTAETLFSNALDVSSTDDRAHAGLAESLWQRGERDSAVQHLERAVRLSAGDPKHVLRLGRMYLELGRLDEANEQSLAALRAERNSAEIWTLRGDCFRASGEEEQALAAYHRALALRPDYPKAQIQAAEIYHDQQRFDRLIATIDRLRENVGTEQAPARADMLRGMAMSQLGRPAEARRCFALAATKEPTDPQPHLQLASLAWQAGDAISTRRSLARAFELDPESIRDHPGADAQLLAQLQLVTPQVADQSVTNDTDGPAVRR